VLLTRRIYSNGNVTQGVLSILSELPIVKVNVGDLPALVSDPGDMTFTLWATTSSDGFVQALTYEKYTSSTLFPALIYLAQTVHRMTALTTTLILRNIIRYSIRRSLPIKFLSDFT
jgi:hypothetical protein